ncbi:MAG TPA: endolytic transglycosylase MltG [Candidatus Paceibacterota bacterium]|nr:endolytic transglycosylase MltG [Candidatus Paceibacterota bacterium]
MNFFKQRNPWVLVLVFLGIGAAGSYALLAAPNNFSSGTIVRIQYGTSVPEIAKELADAHVIAHPTLFRLFLRLAGTSNDIQTGVYKFKNPPNLFQVVFRLATGDFGLPAVRLTFIEGATVREDALQIAQALPDISAKNFLTLAAGQEGYLFPDTYFFQSSADVPSIIALMRSNFDAKIALLTPDIATSKHSLSDIVIMASLIEKEARTSADRRMVSGILWNRIARSMPLQVDAVFGYIYNRETYAPSFTDLKVDSPYNTYLHIGLPPGPIDNPGLDSLEAAVHPTPTHYLYYLTDKNGDMHYATTYAEHQANLRTYLR